MKEDFYAITTLQFDAKSFQTKEMSAEIGKLMMCQPIFDFAQTFLLVLPHFSKHVNLINYESIKEGETHEKKSKAIYERI
jgi:hypothetical protein